MFLNYLDCGNINMSNTSNTKILVSKENRSTKIALGIAIILIILLYLVLSANPENSEAKNYNGFITLALIGGAIYYYTKRKTKTLTNEQVIALVAQYMYRNAAIHIDSIYSNIKIVQGNVGERYIQLKTPAMTFLYRDGFGIVEQHPGLLVTQVLKEQAEDEIAITRGKMKLKEDAMYRRLDDMGALPEEASEQ